MFIRCKESVMFNKVICTQIEEFGGEGDFSQPESPFSEVMARPMMKKESLHPHDEEIIRRLDQIEEELNSIRALKNNGQILLEILTALGTILTTISSFKKK